MLVPAPHATFYSEAAIVPAPLDPLPEPMDLVLDLVADMPLVGNLGSGLFFFLLVVPALLLGLWVAAHFQRVLTQYLRVACRSGLTGFDAARKLLEHAGIKGVRIVPTHGTWVTDHYNPLTQEVVLSQAIYTGASISAVGIAAHEIGHAVQHASGYSLWLLRTALIRVSAVCFVLGFAVVFLGVLVDSLPVTWAGVGLFVVCLLFPLVRLPLELDASARARTLAREAGILQAEEVAAFDRVLQAAALTYLAAALQGTIAVGAFALYLLFGQHSRAGVFNEEMACVVSLAATAVVLYLCHQRDQAKKAAQTPSAVGLHNRGSFLADQGLLAEAIAAFTKAIQLDPHFALAYLGRGSAYLQTAQYEEALADLDTAVRLDPYLVIARANRSATHLCMGQPDKALADADAALRLDPEQGDLYLGRGLIHFQQQRYDAALADFDAALGRQPRDIAVVHLQCGNVWLVQGENQRAITCYNQAIEAGGPRPQFLGARGTAWLFLGELDRAIADLDEAIREGPVDGLAYNNRGTALLRRGDYARAADDLRKAIRLLPQHPNAYKNLAWLQATCPDASFRDAAQALANIQQALQLAGPAGALWHDILAAAHAEAGNFAEAIRCQQQCLADAPRPPQAEMQARLELYQAGQAYRERPRVAALV